MDSKLLRRNDSNTSSLSKNTEDVLKKLQSVGLNPNYYNTLESAADGVVKIVENLRGDLADPPHHVQCLVLQKLGVEGHVKDGIKPKLRLVSIKDHEDC